MTKEDRSAYSLEDISAPGCAGFKLYLGRDDEHHGAWLCTLSDFDKDGERTRAAIIDALNKQMRIDDADICIRALYKVLKEASERCGVENNQFIPSQIVGAMFSAEQWMQGKYGHFEDIKVQYDEQLETIVADEERITEVEGGLQEIIDHAYENGSHARTMRKIAIGTLRGRRG